MRIVSFLAAFALSAGPALAQTPCGGSFGGFVNELKNEAMAKGHGGQRL